MTKAGRQKGKNKRCSDQLIVGGVPTRAGELVWARRGNKVVRIKSRKQLTDEPEKLVVAPNGTAVQSGWFDAGAELGNKAWAGYTNKTLARGGTGRRRGRGVALSTASSDTELRARVEPIYARARLDLGLDEPTQAAIAEFAEAVRNRGGRAVVVGGAVRDALDGWAGLRGSTVKDADLEVYGLEPGVIREMAEQRWKVDMTGASFAVLKAYVKGGKEPLDISVPRREAAVGDGHRDFIVSADPTMSIAEAASRRDFTINAMSFDPLTNELIDPYGGAADLAAKVLRHVSDAFDEDPLRAMRAARFAARFDMRVHPDTKERCRRLYARAETVAKERRWGEMTTTFRQARRPGQALVVLEEIGWIGILPEVANLRGVEQSSIWHPEGDVFTHTAEVLNYWGAHLRTGDDETDLIVAVAAMCHDLGKATTTTLRDGKITSYGHDRAGGSLVSDLLGSYNEKSLIKEVRPLVEHHLAPVQLVKAGAGDSAYRRLSLKVNRLDLLTLVARADQGGRPPKDPTAALAQCDVFYNKAKTLGILEGPPAALAKGEMLMDLGIAPGPIYSKLLGEVYTAQIAGRVKDAQEAKEMLGRITKKIRNNQGGVAGKGGRTT